MTKFSSRPNLTTDMERQSTSTPNVNVPKVTVRIPGCGCGFAVIVIVLLCFASTIKGCVVDIIHAYHGETTEASK